jgi:hypothetical protein
VRDGKVMHALACVLCCGKWGSSEIALGSFVSRPPYILRGLKMSAPCCANRARNVSAPFLLHVHYLQFFRLSSCTHTYITDSLYFPQQKEIALHTVCSVITPDSSFQIVRLKLIFVSISLSPAFENKSLSVCNNPTSTHILKD